MVKRLVSIIISILFIVSSIYFFGCDKGCDRKTENPNSKTSFKETDIVLANNGVTDYKVVIPEDANEYEQYAAEEMVLFFEQATGATLPVISDNGLIFNEKDYYLSIGNTTIFEGSGIDASYDQLGRDGYKIVRKGKTVILKGGEDEGNIYAVYGFLNKQVDWKAYAANEIYVREVSKLNLIDFNWIDVPDFATRAGGYYVTYSDRVFATRLRTLAGYSWRLFADESVWGLWAHTYFWLLPPKTYQDIHPDWYGAGGQQLCLSNMEMRDELIKNLKDRILTDNSTAEMWMVGQEDNPYFCSCDNCNKISLKYGKSGLMMQFVNQVADEIEEWRKEVCPERKLTIMTFAYQPTAEPPVIKNADGSYSPIDDSVVAHDNVAVLLAPVSCDYLAPYNDAEINPETTKMFEGWQVCADRFAIWGYCNNFTQGLEYFDNVNAIATNYQLFRDIGAFYLYDESSGSQKQGFAFQQMMAFVHSELMWDCEQNVNDLIDDFMLHYYKEAYKPMRDYWDLISSYVTHKKLELGEKNNKYYGTAIFNSEGTEKETLLSADFWSKQVLEKMLDYFEDAYDLIEQSYTGGQKDIMLDRLKIESLTPRMYLIHLYNNVINPTECLEMIDGFESDARRFGVNIITNRRTSLDADLAAWRKKVLG